MAKFVARSFIPGEAINRDNGYAFNTAWEAWECLAEDRLKAEAMAAGADPEAYVAPRYGVWGDMYELAQPEAYDDNGIFGVASNGEHWYGSIGTGAMWARTPGQDKADTSDLGIVYMVEFTAEYVGL